MDATFYDASANAIMKRNAPEHADGPKASQSSSNREAAISTAMIRIMA
jgi:hypothetical protein